MDIFVRDLQSALYARNLSDIVNLIFVSDHGMSDTISPELVYVDDILGAEAYAKVTHKDGKDVLERALSFELNLGLFVD